MHVETKFLRLFRAVELGEDIAGWRVCWLGGWDKCRVLFVVMAKRVTDRPRLEPALTPLPALETAARSPVLTPTAVRNGARSRKALFLEVTLTESPPSFVRLGALQDPGKVRVGSRSRLLRQSPEAFNLASDGGLVSLYIAILITQDAWLGAFALLLGLLQFGVLVATSKPMRILMDRDLAAGAASQSYLVEALSGIGVFKASGAEDRVLRYWSTLFSKHLRVSLERGLPTWSHTRSLAARPPVDQCTFGLRAATIR